MSGADISPNDSASRLRSAGVDVYFGEARFASRSTIEVAGRTLAFKRAVIATGGRPAVPPIPGLSSVAYLTNETLFSLTERPRRLAILGAGPIGCEMAQAFARLGSAVTLVDQASRVLPSEGRRRRRDRRGADGAWTASRSVNAGVASARQEADGIVVRIERGEAHRDVACDRLLVAVGRAPNLDALDLPAAGVAAGPEGVTVDDRLRTSNPRIFAAGDICSRFKFTHAADAAARIVIQNALFFGRARASALVVPWCTYTDPEVAQVGWQADEARRHGHEVETITIPLADVDRAVVDEERDGFVRIHHVRGRLLGCTVVSSRAGEMIGLAAYALKHGGRLGDLGSVIYPYPTQTNAFRAAGDAFGRSRRRRASARWEVVFRSQCPPLAGPWTTA